MNNGYIFIMVANKSRDLTYNEYTEIVKCKGFHLLAPDHGESFTILLEPGQTRVILCRVDGNAKDRSLQLKKKVFLHESTKILKVNAMLKPKIIRAPGVFFYFH